MNEPGTGSAAAPEPDRRSLEDGASRLDTAEIIWRQPQRPLLYRFARTLGLSARNAVNQAIDRFGIPESPIAETPAAEAIRLLRLAAGVEHALLVQYLYSGYSLDPDFEDYLATTTIGDGLVRIAVQEMGHLVGVQNLLLALGAEPTLVRQDQLGAPASSPFPYRLEPFSSRTLALYLLAESPMLELNELPAQVRAFIDHSLGKLDLDQDGRPDAAVQAIGLVYAKLYWLFQDSDAPAEWAEVAGAFGGLEDYIGRHVGPDVLVQDSADRQSLLDEWGSYATSFGLTIPRDPVLNNGDVRRLLYDIARQGEGYADATRSHFQVFCALQSETESWAGALARDMPAAPTAAAAPGPGRTPIDDPASAAIAQVFDAVYELLLWVIACGLAVPRGGGTVGQRRTALLFTQLFVLMRQTQDLAWVLRELPLGPASDQRAGPPFDLSMIVEGVTPSNVKAQLEAAVDHALQRVRAAQPKVGGDAAENVADVLDNIAALQAMLPEWPREAQE